MNQHEGQVENTEATALEKRISAILEHHWTPEGYAAPNASVYPWQWLWDSCFHAVIWQALGKPDRSIAELTEALSTQTATGFVPHMNYRVNPEASLGYWGRKGTSTITQPPMYGHAIAELLEGGVTVADQLIESAVLGFEFLLKRRHRDEESDLILLCHPWESGADDSPRWDDTCPGGEWASSRWADFKTELVGSVEFDGSGGAIRNLKFHVASVGFNALVAFNALRLADATGTTGLAEQATELAQAIDFRWSSTSQTWVDGGTTAKGSGRVRTADALLPLLVSQRSDAIEACVEQLQNPAAFGGQYGPAGVHRSENQYAESTYWRGPVWPQLGYLLWLAARNQRRGELATSLAQGVVRGAITSEFAEYWNADTGAGLGAIPQSWAGLSLAMARGPMARGK